MTKKVKGTIASAFVMASMLFGQATLAQGTTTPPNATQQQQTENFSDAELKKFIQASAKAQAVQQQNQQAMMAKIEKENLSIDKFNELAQAHQQQKLGEVNATPEELAAFNNAAQEIMEMQPKVEKEMKQAIAEEIPVERFEKIMLAYQQDPNVQAKVNKLVQELQ